MIGTANFRFDTPSFLAKNSMINVVKQLGPVLIPKTLIPREVGTQGAGYLGGWVPRRLGTDGGLI